MGRRTKLRNKIPLVIMRQDYSTIMLAKYDVYLQEGLTKYKQDPYDMNAALQNLEYQPMVL